MRQMNFNRFTLGVLASLAVAVLCSPVCAEEKESEHLRADLKVVRVGYGVVFPETLTIKASDAVAWSNYSGAPVEIRFRKDTVKKLHCKEPAPFHVEEDQFFTSGEVRPSELVTLCHFLPGEYEYTVLRKFSPSSPRGGPAQSTGKISVAE